MILFILAMCFCSTAFAADVSLVWDPSDGATSYEIEMLSGEDWNTAESRTGTIEPNFIWTDAPEDKLLLFRCSAINQSGKTTKTTSGAWYHGGWKLSPSPTGIGITGE